MKRAQCDNPACLKLADADPTYGSAPSTWVSVGYNPKGGYRSPKDFCTPACAIAWIQAETPTVLAEEPAA